ncbi:hypothetical protein RRG08_024773 [Elysia crispata]|uniref:Uncharacterized protein n=1 Tax=Elysia crispata TaxID=231223 RepID=A0AAE1CT41_9GAST|nr:hypothetical protein RRG08_024773 [Elysia crispata]
MVLRIEKTPGKSELSAFLSFPFILTPEDWLAATSFLYQLDFLRSGKTLQHPPIGRNCCSKLCSELISYDAHREPQTLRASTLFVP